MKNLSLLLSIVFYAFNVLAAPPAIQSSHYIDLRAYSGQSFLQTMIEEEVGVVAHFDADYVQDYEFASWKEVSYAIDNFDDKNKFRILKMFNNDKSLLKDFSQRLKEQEGTFSPANISDKVGKVLSQMNISGDRYSLGQFMAIASGAGTLIRINDDNYFYNIGYFDPEVRSGRSYGATLVHNANDASHLMYLRELEDYLKRPTNDIRLFFRGIIKFLVDTDVSIFEDPNFNKYGESVLTDYITVYTAELRRHLMKDLRPNSSPWGNDMTEATFLSLFNVKTGLMMLEEGLVESSIKEHWALSKTGSGRSGFGINRKYRRTLQASISAILREHEDKNVRNVVLKIDKLIGKKSDGDVFRGVMEFLNNQKNLSDPSRVENVEDDLVELFLDFLIMTHDYADEIVESLSE